MINIRFINDLEYKVFINFLLDNIKRLTDVHNSECKLSLPTSTCLISSHTIILLSVDFQFDADVKRPMTAQMTDLVIDELTKQKSSGSLETNLFQPKGLRYGLAMSASLFLAFLAAVNADMGKCFVTNCGHCFGRIFDPFDDAIDFTM